MSGGAATSASKTLEELTVSARRRRKLNKIDVFSHANMKVLRGEDALWTVLCVWKREAISRSRAFEIEIVGELACDRGGRANGRAAAACGAWFYASGRIGLTHLFRMRRFFVGNARTHFELLALAAGPAAHSRAKERRSVELGSRGGAIERRGGREWRCAGAAR